MKKMKNLKFGGVSWSGDTGDACCWIDEPNSPFDVLEGVPCSAIAGHLPGDAITADEWEDIVRTYHPDPATLPDRLNFRRSL